MVEIPSFNPSKAEDYLNTHKLMPYFRLLYLRDVLKVKMETNEYLEEQERFLSQKRISRLLNKQLDTGSWLPTEKDNVWGPMHKSTVWTLLFFGYFGINGSLLPNIIKAVDYIFDTKINLNEYVFRENHKIWGHFMQCENSMILRSLLLLGFNQREDVKRACLAHLKRIDGKEGLCYYKKGPKSKDRFQLPCAWGLVKDLLFLNEWPDQWKNVEYKNTIKNIQEFLLAQNLASADFPRIKEAISKKWFAFAYFRSYYADLFEAVESLIMGGLVNHNKIDETLQIIGKHCKNSVTWLCGITPTWPIQFEKVQTPSPWLTIKGLKFSNI
ncbi:MAG: hypothetical protein ACFFAU_07490 [Candidatus Hodarchaeota archaeon]